MGHRTWKNTVLPIPLLSDAYVSIRELTATWRTHLRISFRVVILMPDAKQKGIKRLVRKTQWFD